MISFTVPSVPVAQPRVKAASRGGFTSVYTPTKKANGRSNGIAEYKASVRQAFAEVYREAPLDCPVMLDVVFILPRTKGQIWKRKEMPRLIHDKTPDVDNLMKSLMDALTGLAWIDDTQVWRAQLTKVIAAGDEQPCVCVKIRRSLGGEAVSV